MPAITADTLTLPRVPLPNPATGTQRPVQSVTNGDTQWMTAGGGILHIEKPPEQLIAPAGCFTVSSCG